MTLAELQAAAERIPDLEKRLATLEENDHRDEQSNWPEFVSLRLLCERCSLSYSTMRRGEHKHELPNGGRHDVTISGRRFWVRNSVESWLERLGR